MPSRNMFVIVLAVIISAACHRRSDQNRYGRYLTQVLDSIDQWALEPVKQDDLFDSAMRGIVSQLDEYSSYISAEDTGEFEANIEQEFGGIGVMIKLEGDRKQLTVVSPPLFGTPALKAGIRVRDRILEIDGVSTEGMTMDRVIRLMRGKKGDPVRLRIQHEGDEQPITLDIVRDTINVPSVVGDRRRKDGSWDFRLSQDPRIGYIRIINFGEKTSGELETALASSKSERIWAMIIDLRDNAGGLLDVAVATCDQFLPGGRTIVSIRGRNRSLDEVIESSSRSMFPDIPIVVLVNRYSASASEIVTACLQDHKRAVVVGQRTWGKGTVQHVLPIESGRSILKLTAASYWRPSGKNIHRLGNARLEEWGVTPDEGFAVPLSDEEQKLLREQRAQRDLWKPGQDQESRANNPITVDRQLDKGVEYLQELLGNRT